MPLALEYYLGVIKNAADFNSSQSDNFGLDSTRFIKSDDKELEIEENPKQKSKKRGEEIAQLYAKQKNCQ